MLLVLTTPFGPDECDEIASNPPTMNSSKFDRTMIVVVEYCQWQDCATANHLNVLNKVQAKCRCAVHPSCNTFHRIFLSVQAFAITMPHALSCAFITRNTRAAILNDVLSVASPTQYNRSTIGSGVLLLPISTNYHVTPLYDTKTAHITDTWVCETLCTTQFTGGYQKSWDLRPYYWGVGSRSCKQQLTAYKPLNPPTKYWGRRVSNWRFQHCMRKNELCHNPCWYMCVNCQCCEIGQYDTHVWIRPYFKSI